MKKRCYIYTRVSTAAQVEGYSLEAQAERLREYADYRELEIAGEYCDAGKSGRSIKGRPAFQQMLDDIVCEKDGVSFVLVFKLSRFGRNAADVLKSMQLLTDCEVDLVCVEDAIDSSTQGGRLTMAILSAVAEIEKENITAQFLSGKMQKLSEGGWPGGPIPYGYRNINKKLVVQPEEAELVRMVFSLYRQEGMMVNSVVNYLNEHGYKKTVRNEQRAFTFDMVGTILDNPVYCGKIFYNRRSNCKAGNQKKKDVIVVDGSHEPLVTPEQWHFVRMKRERHKGRGKKTEEPERISLLSGLVKCPKCGSGMIAKKNKSINHNHGGYYKTLYYYGCNNNRKCNGRVCDFSHGELWTAAQERRKETGVKWNKTHSLDHEHLLAGLVICPVCGKGLAGTVRRRKNKKTGEYKDDFYYRCQHRKKIDEEHFCDFRPSINQNEFNREVENVILDMAADEQWKEFVLRKMSERVDVSTLETEREQIKKQLRQVIGAKTKLTDMLDKLDVSDKHYDRKYQDMQDRLDNLYDKASELEDTIADIDSQINGAYEKQITAKQLYKILANFDRLYYRLTDLEKKEFLRDFIESVEIYPEKLDNGRMLKQINFNFPVYYDGEVGKEIRLLNENTVETVVLIQRKDT